MTKAALFQPTLSAILRYRALSSIISGVALLQLMLSLGHFPNWPCPFFHALKIPCPGCGMTRASLFLFNGQWRQAVATHAFAPLLLVALALIGVCAIAPKNHVERIAGHTESIERYTGLTTLLLSGLILYWLARLLILQAAFVRLVQG